LTYKLVRNSSIWREVEVIWKLCTNFEGTYREDYKLLMNIESRTAWIEATFYRPNEQWKGDALPRKEMQPIPDYIRWLATGGQLHYLSFDRIQLMKGDWDNCPGLSRPARMLDMLMAMNPPPSYFATVALLVWIPEQDVRRYYKEQHDKMVAEIEEDQERERWRSHALFSKKSCFPTGYVQNEGTFKQRAETPSGRTDRNL
jgi:hypothetical protein